MSQPDISPRLLRHSFLEHNRHCWLGALASLGCAALLWILYGALYTALALTFETVRTGNPGLATAPRWYPYWGGGLVLGLCLWAGVDRWRKRFRPVSDRPIIGWHLIPDILLLPPRMTIAIWENVRSRIVLNAWECEESFRLFQIILAEKRISPAMLGAEVGDTALLERMLLALQVTGWIDLHRGEDDWFYRVRSDVADNLLPSA